MSDVPMSNPDTQPDAAIAVSEQTQPMHQPMPLGTAFWMSMTTAAETTQPEGEPIAYPIATNFCRATEASFLHL